MNQKYGSVLAVAGVGAASSILCLPLLSFHFGFDQAAYAALADILLHGGLPYRDAWDFRPPGILYAYQVAFLLFGLTEWSVRVLELIGIGATSAGLVRLGERRFGSRRVGIIAGLVVPLLYTSFGSWQTAQPESYQMPFMVWGLALWPRSTDADRLGFRCYMTGLLLGSALSFKTTAAVAIVVVLADRFLTDLRKPGWKERTVPGILMLTGVSTLPVLICVYYGIRGNLGHMLYELLVFAPQYALLNYRSMSEFLPEGLSKFVSLLTVPALVLAFLGGLLGFSFQRKETLRWLAVTSATLLSVALQMKFFDYHYLTLLPFLAMLIGLGGLRLGWRLDQGRRARVKAGILQSCLALLAIVLAAGYVDRSRGDWQNLMDITRDGRLSGILDRESLVHGKAYEIGRTIRDLTRPDDSIFVWGQAAPLYHLSGRTPASPYPHILPIIAPWTGPWREQRLVEQFKATPPALIVVVTGDAAPYATGRFEDSDSLLKEFTQFDRFIADHYVLSGKVGNCFLWTRSGR